VSTDADRIDQYPPQTRSTRRSSLADEVAKYVRRLILTGRLRPGERIDQEAVSAALDVSRSPVREAVVMLSSEGLVTLSPNRGAFVAEITEADIADHYELFGAVSGRAAALAAQLLGDADIVELKAAHARFRQQNRTTMSAANHDFHRIINMIASRRTRWLLGLLERSVPNDFYEFTDGQYVDAVADHAAILDAIIARDSEAARRAMEDHLRKGGLAAADALRRQGFWKDQPR
jgi:DNA-binding GntR family transcriptional regulator